MKKLVYICLALGAIVSCARMGSPDGGWYDDDPPKVVSSSPADQSVNVTTKKISILFNEYIKLEDATNKVIVSPPQLEVPEIKAAGKKVIVELQDSLKPNTTYTIDFSDAISDNNEGNPMGSFTYSFSTGDKIDTLEAMCSTPAIWNPSRVSRWVFTRILPIRLSRPSPCFVYRVQTVVDIL